MSAQPENKFLIASCVFHAGILLALIVSYSFSSPMFVIENTNQHDVISAVILGDTAKSKILPHEAPAVKPVQKPEPVKKEVAPPPKPVAKVEPKKTVPPKTIDKDVIALKAAEKKLADKKAEELKKKQQEAFAKDLLADLKKQSDKKNESEAGRLAVQVRKDVERAIGAITASEPVKRKYKNERQAVAAVTRDCE